jgi:hypothetical protein
MVDVTVDAKPAPQLPYDPNSIPPAVRARAAAVDALYGVTGKPVEPVAQEQAAPEPPPAQAEPETYSPEEREAARQITAPPPEPAPQPTAAEKRHEARMKGNDKTEQLKRTIDEMQQQMAQMGNELLRAQQALARPQAPSPPPPPPTYITEQDVANYGNDLIDFTKRAAAQVVAPQLQQMHQQNEEMRQRLAQEARHNLDQRVELAVPNYREIDRNPRWHNWLLSIDLLSGRVRQQLLNEAIAAADAPRVISFFRGFLQDEQATGHEPSASPLLSQAMPPRDQSVLSQAAPPREPAIPLASLAAPGRARPASGGDAFMQPDKPIYTRANLRDLYTAHRKGAYVGREAEWARIDADIIAAGREGRIR